jgi:hypothetical protein
MSVRTPRARIPHARAAFTMDSAVTPSRLAPVMSRSSRRSARLS